MILIAGDSWGCGEWGSTHGHSAVTHGGITQYLIDDGYEVYNLASGGASLAGTLAQLRSGIKLCSEPHKIFVFQTEWIRSFDGISITESTFDQSFIESIICDWMHDLSAFAVEKNLRIGIIGGSSDTMHFEDFGEQFPGLYVACQSVVNLCTDDSDRISDPIFVLEWRDIHRFKNLCKTAQELEYLLDSIEKSDDRYKALRRYPHWFAPDFCHANRNAHKKLYDFLRGKNYV